MARRARVAQAVGALSGSGRPADGGQRAATELLLTARPSRAAGLGQGADQRVHFIDWEHPERNDFLVDQPVPGRRARRPGARVRRARPRAVRQRHPAGRHRVQEPVHHRPDGRGRSTSCAATPTSAALEQPEGNEQLFHTNQFVVATYVDKARVGTFTAGAEHYPGVEGPVPAVSRASWRGGSASTRRRSDGQELLVAGIC